MFAVIIIAAVAAALWSTLYVLRGSLVAGCLLCVLVAACCGFEFLHFSLGPIPLTLDRLVLVLVVVAYVVQRRLGRAEPKPMGREDWLVAAFSVVLAASALWAHVSDEIAPGESAILLRLVCSYLIPALLYWIARQARLTDRTLMWVGGTLAVFSVYLALTGVMEVNRQWWAVFPNHSADPAIGLHFGRARGPMVHAVSYGLYLGVALLAAALWARRFGRRGALLLAAIVPLGLTGIYFSYTRSVWIGTGLGIAVLLAMTLRGAWRPLVLGGLVVSTLLAVVTNFEKIKGFQREQSAAETSQSVDLRGSMAYVSWKMFLDHPLLGVGFDRFPTARLPYLSDRSSDLDLEATRPYVHHNTLLSLLTETGMVGLGLYLAMLGAWAAAAWRLARNAALPDGTRSFGVLMLAALAVYVPQALFHELSYVPVNNTLLYFLAGITVGLVRQQQMADEGTNRARTGLAPACGILTRPA
jgi:O-antigen ligase